MRDGDDMRLAGDRFTLGALRVQMTCKGDVYMRRYITVPERASEAYGDILLHAAIFGQVLEREGVCRPEVEVEFQIKPVSDTFDGSPGIKITKVNR